MGALLALVFSERDGRAVSREELSLGRPLLPQLPAGDAHACLPQRCAMSATAQPALATSGDTDLQYLQGLAPNFI